MQVAAFPQGLKPVPSNMRKISSQNKGIFKSSMIYG